MLLYLALISMNDEGLPPSADNSSDMFDSDDASFIAALANTVLPGDIVDTNATSLNSESTKKDTESVFAERDLTPPPSTQVPRKRRLTDSSEPAEDRDTPHDSRHASGPRVLSSGDGSSYMDAHTYGAAHFGDFGEYMSRKRAKLQLQNVELDDADDEDRDGARAEIRRRQIFKGLAIYVGVFTFRFLVIFELTNCLSDQWVDRSIRARPSKTDRQTWR